MRNSIAVLLVAASAAFLKPDSLWAVTIPTVPVGDAGNAGELSGPSAPGGAGLDAIVGGVAYDYRIGTTEVTNAQYVDFLNAVADADPYGLYNTSMGSTTRGGITRTGSSPNFSYSVKTAVGSYTYDDKPVVYVSWGDAARFANWMHNGQPVGAQAASTTEDGSYTLNGALTKPELIAVLRNSDATWVVPSEDEWYKAAYYDGDSETYFNLATGTDTPSDNNLPSLDSGNSDNFYSSGYTTGSSSYPMTDAGAYAASASPYGTFDQGGNVVEWTDNPNGFENARRRAAGGSFQDSANLLLAPYRVGMYFSDYEADFVGFRLAAVPEPCTAVLAAIGIAGLAIAAARRRKR